MDKCCHKGKIQTVVLSCLQKPSQQKSGVLVQLGYFSHLENITKLV